MIQKTRQFLNLPRLIVINNIAITALSFHGFFFFFIYIDRKIVIDFKLIDLILDDWA